MAGSTGTYFYDTEAMRSATQGFEQSNKKVMDIFREMMNVINSLKNNSLTRSFNTEIPKK